MYIAEAVTAALAAGATVTAGLSLLQKLTKKARKTTDH